MTIEFVKNLAKFRLDYEQSEIDDILHVCTVTLMIDEVQSEIADILYVCTE